MPLLFWTSLVFVGYTYFGYALVLAVYARVRSCPARFAPYLPAVSVVMAAHNEEANLPAKLANLFSLDYPPELLQVVVVSDGSNDSTAEVLQAHAGRITPVVLTQPEGKSSALNHAVARATGDVLFFCDVRQRIEPGALKHLVSAFADAEVGAVSGELVFETSPDGPGGDGLGVYWKLEKLVRKLESQTGSVVGVTGAIYALRRELYRELPSGTLLDDVLVPMNVARLGKRVVFQPAAIAWDRIFNDPAKEFARKVRTLTGNYQLVSLAPWLVSLQDPLLFRFVSHKLLRLFVPFALLLMLLSSGSASGYSMRLFFVLQVIFYILAGLGAIAPGTKMLRPVAIAYTFVLLNGAALMAFRNAVTGKTKVWN